MIPHPKRLLTAQEVAELLNVTPSWVKDHSNGKRQPMLPSIQLGKLRRFRADEIERWLSRLSQGNGGRV